MNSWLGNWAGTRLVWFNLWLAIAGATPMAQAEPAINLTLWDTMAAMPSGNPTERTLWKVVPSDLLSLEANPAKARSDPGYYGRDYSFKGDAVVEGRGFTAVFWSTGGRVLIYLPPAAAETNAGTGMKLAEIGPLANGATKTKIKGFRLLRNTGDELALEATFSATGDQESSEVFIFDRSNILEIKPGQNAKGITLSSPLAGGIVPGFIGDDLIYNATDLPRAKTLNLPAENFLLGLVQGEQHELVLTWPKGKQTLSIHTAAETSGEGLIESVDLTQDGQSLYLACASAPGIWHKETLKPTYLEKDVTSQWKKPFPARWKTQLLEAGVKTTYAFKAAREEIWRGVPGSYIYPVWFEGDSAIYHLGKKVPPKGESLIYALEPQNTPPAISLPVDALKSTLGRALAESIIDLDGRKLSTHHRRGGDGVHRACTCGCTEAIQTIFEAQQESTRNEFVAGAVEDMLYFVHRHVERINQYRKFSSELAIFLNQQSNTHPELKTYIEKLQEITREIPEACQVQAENMKSLDYADQLAKRTLSLTATKDPTHLKAYLELGTAWREMGGAQDYVIAQCHAITRKLCQEAGYGCADQPNAVPLAEAVRQRCRQTLREPDGYEIWADY